MEISVEYHGDLSGVSWRSQWSIMEISVKYDGDLSGV